METTFRNSMIYWLSSILFTGDKETIFIQLRLFDIHVKKYII